MAVAAEDNQIAGAFVTQALIRPMVDFEPVFAVAHLAAILGPLQCPAAAGLPAIGFEVFAVRELRSCPGAAALVADAEFPGKHGTGGGVVLGEERLTAFVTGATDSRGGRGGFTNVC